MTQADSNPVIFVFHYFTAERNLSQAQKVAGHPLQVLQIVATATAAEGPIQQAAAVHFKNIVKKGWEADVSVGSLILVCAVGRISFCKSHTRVLTKQFLNLYCCLIGKSRGNRHFPRRS